MKNKFLGQQNYQHGKVAKLGILVVNLGTPEAPTAPALRKYLAEFLSDQRVVEIPRLLWMMIFTWSYFTNSSRKISQSL